MSDDDYRSLLAWVDGRHREGFRAGLLIGGLFGATAVLVLIVFLAVVCQ